MLPKFYIVKDYEDLLSGKIIPRKVLNYLPINTLSPVILPKPIKRATELSISPNTYSPMMLSSINQFSPMVQYRRIPLNTPCATTTPCGSSLQLGPPIIKMGPMMSQNIPGVIKVIVNGITYTINIPTNYIRNIASDIYKYSTYSGTPSAVFRLTTPTVDWSANIAHVKLLNLFDYMNRSYSGLIYKINDREVSFNDLYRNLQRIFV